jgi:adenylate cyclase
MSFDPEDAKAYSVGSFLLRFLGQHDRAVEWAKRAMEIDPNDHLVQYNGACFFLKMGQTDYALDLLDRCMPHLGRAQLDWMLLDPDFGAVRDHPKYLELVQREQKRWSRTSG